ncbi:MAG: hypothetical protein DDT40_01335 [candidate division WS2 bacterium]|nr:hypothetical protein [Candidatus Psychracetigena formicireducens]
MENPSCLHTFFNKLIISSSLRFLKSNLKHLEAIVGGTLWGSVVAKTKTTKLGGSSRVFNRALKASVVSI